MSTHRSAFSLVEISIVLAILGLLIGGIVGGQSLIRASGLRTVGADYQKYVNATGLFQAEFMALPGDMTNASSYWGAADGTTGLTAACVTTIGSGTATCNGNGDGYVYLSTASHENFRYWQQLANAGLITGSYTGVQDGVSSSAATTNNSPTSKLRNAIWFNWNWLTPFSGNTLFFDGSYTNTMTYGGVVTNASPTGGIMQPGELYNIDVKFDDGKPGTGKIMASWTGCTTASASTQATTAAYNLSSTAYNCFIIFPEALAVRNNT